LCYHTKFRAQFYPFRSYGGATNFKIRSRDPDHAHFRGKFVVHWLEHVIVNVCTKYDVSIFGHSKDIKGFQNFEIVHVTNFGVKFSYYDKGLHAVY